MPVMDGFEATLEIRKNGINTSTPIIALTASTFLDKKKHALYSGMEDFLTKPFTPQQLAAIIQKYSNTWNNTQSEPKEANLIESKETLELDADYLINIYGDDKAYAADILSIFIDTIENDLTELFDAIAKAHYQSVKQTAHRIKPSFAMVGLGKLSKLMKDLEILAKEENLEELLLIKSRLEKDAIEYIDLVKNELIQLSASI
jgi:HPt (histidine-containing phosphotransfer) domain-containing protein